MQRIYLRALTGEDLCQMLEWPKYQDRENIWANLPGETLEEAEQWLNRYQHPPSSHCLAIVNEGKELVGRVNLAVLDEPTGVGGVFAFTIRPDKNDLGYGQRALQELLDYSFLHLGLSAVYLYTLATNAKARHIYDKFGFQFMGIHQDYREGLGKVKFVDLVLWQENWYRGTNREQVRIKNG